MFNIFSLKCFIKNCLELKSKSVVQTHILAPLTRVGIERVFSVREVIPSLYKYIYTIYIEISEIKKKCKI